MNNKVQQCSYWTLVINPNAKCYSNVQTILDSLESDNPNFEYSYIYHSEPDDDSNNPNHIHLVLYFKGKVKRFNTIFNLFEGAHIESTNQQRYLRCIQYLIHLNNPEKFQYKACDIISNLTNDYLQEILISSGYEFELFREEKLYDYFDEFLSEKGRVSIDMFVLRFGLSAIKSFYFIIKDLISQYNDNILIFKRKHLTDLEIAWNIYSANLRLEFKLARYYHYVNNQYSYEDYERECYQDFLNNVEKGIIDIQKIIKEGVK